PATRGTLRSVHEIYISPSGLVQGSPTDCSCQLGHPPRAPAFSNFVCPANENQACFRPITLDLLGGHDLRLFPLLFPATLAPQAIYLVYPSRWPRLVSSFFLRKRRSGENRDR